MSSENYDYGGDQYAIVEGEAPQPEEAKTIGPADVGDLFPDFSLDSQLGPISYRDYIDGKWGLVITINKCFDPVATSDIGMLSKLIEEFESRNVAVCVIGTDTVAHYRKWIRDIEELEEVKVKVPIISDPDCIVLQAIACARKSPVLEEMVVMSHGVFMVDVDKRIRSVMKYGLTTGRNFYEMIRLYDATQLATYFSVVVPANWSNGQDVVVNNAISDEEADKTIAKGYVAIKPWFRLTPAPDTK